MFNRRTVVFSACLGFAFSAAQMRADIIDFETFSGPSTFGGAAQTLNVPTSIGNVVITGGVILTNTTNLPADETSVYGTAYFGGTGNVNTITLNFPSNINNFFVNVYNGETYSDSFTVADNLGHSNTVTLASNTSGGTSLISFPAAGNTVTITTPDPSWDFFIDNVGFNQPTPGTAPEPASIGMFGLAGAGLVLLSRLRRTRPAK